jgi:hypothetical protein
MPPFAQAIQGFEIISKGALKIKVANFGLTALGAFW